MIPHTKAELGPAGTCYRKAEFWLSVSKNFLKERSKADPLETEELLSTGDTKEQLA